MNLITESKGTKTIKTKKPNLWRSFVTLMVTETTSSFFVYTDYESDVKKETSDFIEKHKKAFRSLANK